MGIIEKVLVYGFIAVVILAIVQLRAGRITKDGRPLRKPPNTLPLVGNGILFLQARQKLFSWFVKCERMHGYETLALSVPTLPPGVLINDPRHLEFVFKNEGVFTKGNFVKTRSWDLFGNGIINADGEFWKLQRKAGLNFLSTANMKVLTEVALPQNLAQVTAYVKERAGMVVDLQHVFHEITTMLMGKMAYNMEGMHADDEFSKSFDYASGKTAERFQNPLWFITEVFFGARFRKSVGTVKRFGAKIVSSAVQSRHEGHVPEDHPLNGDESNLEEVSGTLIHSLLDAIGNEQMVADAALTYLTAGRDTTGQALTWCFYLLMRNRYVAAKVRQEVDQLLRDADDHHIPTSKRDPALNIDPTLFTPASMPYTMAVFYETLRLYPPIPFEIRQCTQDTTLPDGTFLPKHSVLVWCIWAMGRSRTTYGDDCNEFRPERWLVPDAETNRPRLVARSASEFPVFNGGPRTCLGKKMAEVIAVQVIATMLWLFDFVPVDAKERTSKSSLTLPMEGGLPVVVKERSRG